MKKELRKNIEKMKRGRAYEKMNGEEQGPKLTGKEHRKNEAEKKIGNNYPGTKHWRMNQGKTSKNELAKNLG